MKPTQILSGNFSKGENAKGNFTGYTASGTKVFIFKEIMATLGFKTDADFKPFFALVDTKEIATRDENGELTTVMAKRLQALSVFKTQPECVAALNSDALLALEAASQLKAAATTAGLNDAEVMKVFNMA